MSDTAPAGSIKAGGAFVEIFTVDGKFHQGMKRIEGKLGQFSTWATQAGAKLAAVGASATALFGGSLLASAKAFADAGSDLADMSDRTGIAVEQLSRLGYAAKLSATSLTAVETGVKAMQKALYEAGEESKTAQKTLEQLGISVDEIKRLKPDQQFAVIAEAISKVTDPTRRAALSMKIFGGAGQELLPLLSQGADGLHRLAEESDRTGATMSQETADAAAKLGESFDRLEASVHGLTTAVGTEFAPEMNDLIDAINEAIPGIVDWIQANKDTIKTAGTAAAVIGTTGLSMIAMGKAAGVASLALSKLPLVFNLLAGNLRKLTLAGLIVGLQQMTKAEVHAHKSFQDLNRELERSIELTQALNDVSGKRAAKSLEAAGAEKDPQKRREALQAEYERLQKELSGQQNNLKGSKADHGANKTWTNWAIDLTWGSGTLMEGRQDIANVQSQISATQENIKNVKGALDSLNAEMAQAPKKTLNLKEVFGSVLSSVQNGLQDAREEMKKEADSLIETILTPAERFQKKMERLNTLRATNNLTDDQFGKLEKQARIDAGLETAKQKLPELDKRASSAAAAQKGSQEAFSAMVQAMNGRHKTEVQIEKNTKDTSKDMKLLAKTMKRTQKDQVTIKQLNMA